MKQKGIIFILSLWVRQRDFFLHNNRLSFEPDINGKKVPYIEMQKNFYTFCYAGNIIRTTITIQGVNVSNSNELFFIATKNTVAVCKYNITDWGENEDKQWSS